MTLDILVFTYTYDRDELLKKSLESMFRNPGMDFRLWVVDNGSYFSNEQGYNSGRKQLNTLIDYYKKGLIEKLIINKQNVGIHFAINQVLAHLKLHSDDPLIRWPDFVFLTNDDMLYEDGWLLDCYNTYMDLENTERVAVVSPFHCKYPSGIITNGMETIKTVAYNNREYEIKNFVSGNTWFMRGSFFIEIIDWYRVDTPIEGGDWEKLEIIQRNNFKCAVTPIEMAHHMEEATGANKYNRLGHW